MNKLIKRIYVKDCPICDQAHEIEERETLIQAKIKGEIITYKEKYYYCKNADPDEREFVPTKMANKNLLAARDAYRRKHHLLSSSEIVDLRKDYNLSLIHI